jgi:rubredoxin
VPRFHVPARCDACGFAFVHGSPMPLDVVARLENITCPACGEKKAHPTGVAHPAPDQRRAHAVDVRLSHGGIGGA